MVLTGKIPHSASYLLQIPVMGGMTFLAFPVYLLIVIYTTNAVESVNMSLRKVMKIRASFPNDKAVYKIFYLALKNIVKN